MRNEFSEKLKEMIQQSGVKQQCIAEATGYDLSYISKWLSGKMLPSEKTIESTIVAIAQCLFDGSIYGQTWLEERYGSSLGELDASCIAKELQDAYGKSKGTHENKSAYHVSLPSKRLYDSVYKLINELGEIVIVVDFFSMDRESRQSLIGIEEGYYKERIYNSDKKITIVFSAYDSQDTVYDTISLIHLTTVYSSFDFSLINDQCASGKVLAVSSNKVISGLIAGNGNKVLAVSCYDAANSGIELQHEILRVAQNTGGVYLKKSMPEFANGKYYLKSMLSTNIKWIQGHITELIMPDELYDNTIQSLSNIDHDEALRIHIFSKNVIDQESTSILLYETAITDLIATGEVDFFNHKIILTSDQIEKYLDYLIETVKGSNIYLVNTPFFTEYKHTFSPCLYISDTICYLRIENAYERDNIYEIVDNRVRDIFYSFYSDIFINRTDAIISEKDIILDRLQNYKKMAHLSSDSLS